MTCSCFALQPNQDEAAVSRCRLAMTKIFAQGCAYLPALCALSRIKLPASEQTHASRWSPVCDVLTHSLLPSPQTELPPSYSVWMDIAHELPQLIASRQLRARIHQVHLTISGFGVLSHFSLTQLGLQRSMRSKPVVL